VSVLGIFTSTGDDHERLTELFSTYNDRLISSRSNLIGLNEDSLLIVMTFL
jgi:hypothetical protein